MQQGLNVKPEIKVKVRRKIGSVVNIFTFIHSELNARVIHLG